MAITKEFQPIYLSIKDTARFTGLSEFYLRKHLKEGNIPHINSGTKIFIHLPSLLSELEQSANCSNGKNTAKSQ